MEADCLRMVEDLEDKKSTVRSLEDQVEDLGKSLSKINAQYQKQFARLEAGQSAAIEAVRSEAMAQVEAVQVEAQSKVAAVQSDSQALLGQSSPLTPSPPPLCLHLTPAPLSCSPHHQLLQRPTQR